MKLKILLFLVLITSALEIKAQDPIFTQSFLVPETLNPGFTGYSNAWHSGLLYRRQWPDGNKRIDTQYGFLNNMVSYQAAIGATFLKHHEVFTNYNFFQFNGVFSYYIPIGYDWGFSPGIEVGRGTKNYNFSNLLLEDQINTNNGSISGTVDPSIFNHSDKIDFFDFSAGFVINNSYSYFGVAVKHLNRPNISFTEFKNVPLDMLLSVHGGYFFSLDDSPSSIFSNNSTLQLTANYMRQSQYNRLDFGAAIEVDKFVIGAVTVTNLEGKSSNSHIVTSINPFVSFNLGELNFGYSYDLNTSKLGINRGIHELSLTWTSKYNCDPCDNYKVKWKKNGEGYTR